MKPNNPNRKKYMLKDILPASHQFAEIVTKGWEGLTEDEALEDCYGRVALVSNDRAVLAFKDGSCCEVVRGDLMGGLTAHDPGMLDNVLRWPGGTRPNTKRVM